MELVEEDKGEAEVEEEVQTCFSALSTEPFVPVPLPHVDVAAAGLGEGLPTDAAVVRLLACRGTTDRWRDAASIMLGTDEGGVTAGQNRDMKKEICGAPIPVAAPRQRITATRRERNVLGIFFFFHFENKS